MQNKKHFYRIFIVFIKVLSNLKKANANNLRLDKLSFISIRSLKQIH